ncbi:MULTISPECIES: DNA double-strand break repair protein Mre11 [Halorussus]|uniref:DNA double-strand break repair protein Mre11 n=1 Tax=Halorussus TaxID=1070314 RepID=UPI0034A2EF68
MTRVIHTGDTHLGYQQYHSPERRADFLAAFEQVVDDAVADDVDAVVHAGDLFHDRRPDLRDLHGTISILRKLRDAGVPFLAIVGNHEGTRGRQWLDLFEMLGLATRLGDEPKVVGDTAFYGLDHVPKSKRDALDYEFADHDRSHAALVGHGLFKPFEPGDWDAEEVLIESNVDFDAFLLGDNHIPDTKEVADTWVTYCGSTERTSTAEREERGYNIVTFEDDGETVTITRRGLDSTRNFEFVEVDLGEDEGIERVREAIREYDLEDAVAVVEIEGEGTDVTPAGVEEFALERGALVARVMDRRERSDEREALDVSFADPDEAVRDRVRDLGLSEAARGIDETVRASKLADANVRESVEKRVDELVEDGDLSAFESAPDDEETGDATDAPESSSSADVTDDAADAANDAEATATAAAEPVDSTDASNSESQDGGATSATDVGDGETVTVDTGTGDTPTADGDGNATGSDGEEVSGADAGDDETASDAESAKNAESAKSAGGDGQSSMEEYL